MTELTDAIGAVNTSPVSVIERATADYQTLAEQIAKAEAHIEHNDSIVANAQQMIAQARQNTREQREFISVSKKRQRVMRRTAHDLENINLGL
jgi:GTP-dependent phosphoenolpyruvate carboxykinase